MKAKRVGYIEFIWAKGRMRLDVQLLSCLILAIDYLKPITCANRLVEKRWAKLKNKIMGWQNVKIVV